MVDLNHDPDPDITGSFTQDRKAVAILDNTIAVIQTANETVTTIFIASEDTGLAVRLVLDSQTLCIAEISHVKLIAVPKGDDKPKPEDK